MVVLLWDLGLTVVPDRPRARAFLTGQIPKVERLSGTVLIILALIVKWPPT